MNRQVASALVVLSLVAGGGVGFAVHRSQQATATTAEPTPSASTTPEGPRGGESTTGPAQVTDAFLVASPTAGATLVATLDLPEFVSIDDVVATVEGEPLPMAMAWVEIGDPQYDVPDTSPLQIGRAWAKGATDRFGDQAYVVHDVEVGDTVRIDIAFSDGKDSAPTPDAKLDVPVVSADVIPDAVLFDGPPPKFTDARIWIYPGSDRAQVSYTAVSRVGGDPVVQLDSITAVDADGDPLEWKHQTATGGPSGIFAPAEPETVPRPTGPALTKEGETGDYDYVDADRVEVGDVVTVRIPFASGVSVVEFEVVAG